MTFLKFRIDGPCIPQGRPRMSLTGHAFTPVRSRVYRDKVRQASDDAMQQAKRLATDCPVRLSVMCYFETPKSFSGVRRKLAYEDKILPAVKSVGDVDNLAKMIMDGITGSAITDDARVVSLYVSKHYAEEAYTEVFIEVVEDD